MYLILSFSIVYHICYQVWYTKGLLDFCSFSRFSKHLLLISLLWQCILAHFLSTVVFLSLCYNISCILWTELLTLRVIFQYTLLLEYSILMFFRVTVGQSFVLFVIICAEVSEIHAVSKCHILYDPIIFRSKIYCPNNILHDGPPISSACLQYIKNCWTTGIKRIHFHCFYWNHKKISNYSLSENSNVLSKFVTLLLVKLFHPSSRFLYFVSPRIYHLK
jgi:hypothetical protein